MLSLDEFKFALTEGHQGPHWKNAYVDRVGNYWIQGNGGLGTTIFQRLYTDHPFVGYIEELLKASLLKQQGFEYQYEAGGEELAQLMPKKSWDSFSEVDKADDDFLSGREQLITKGS